MCVEGVTIVRIELSVFLETLGQVRVGQVLAPKADEVGMATFHGVDGGLAVEAAYRGTGSAAVAL